MTKPEIIRDIVRGQYRQAALQIKHGRSSCCGTALPSDTVDPIISQLYTNAETAVLPTAIMHYLTVFQQKP